MKKNIIVGLVILLVVFYIFSSNSGYAEKWGNGRTIMYKPFRNNEVKGCKGCVWGDGKGGGNMSVITCDNCGNGKPSAVFAPYCPGRKSLHSDGTILAC